MVLKLNLVLLSTEVFGNIDDLEDYSIADELWSVHGVAWNNLDHLILVALIWVLFETVDLISYGVDDVYSS